MPWLARVPMCMGSLNAAPQGCCHVGGVLSCCSAGGVCHVCNEEEEDEDDLVVQVCGWVLHFTHSPLHFPHGCCMHPVPGPARLLFLQIDLPAMQSLSKPLSLTPHTLLLLLCCAVCLLQCNKCRVFVHMTCYGVRQAPNGNLWLCDACSLGLQRPPPCALCPGPCLFAFPGTGFQATSAMVGGCAEAFV